MYDPPCSTGVREKTYFFMRILLQHVQPAHIVYILMPFIFMCQLMRSRVNSAQRPGLVFLADRTNGRAIATLLRLSSVCLRRYVLWLNGAS